MKYLLLFLFIFSGCATFNSGVRNDLYYARQFKKSGDYIRSAIFYQKVLETDKNNIEAIKFLYLFYLENGNKIKAFDMLLKGAKTEPKKVYWHYNMAVMLINGRDFKEGCIELKKASDFSLVERNKKVINKIAKLKEVCVK